MLTYLFRDKSLDHHGDVASPCYDIGCVYRTRNENGLIEAHPLCLAAETALIDLWKFCGLPEEVNFEKCVREANGTDFEALVFFKLCHGYSHTYKNLPLNKLGYFGGMENHMLKIDTVYSSSLHSNKLELVAEEILALHAFARNHLLTILYRCPKGTQTIDFCLLSIYGITAIQVSLQSMTSHTAPNADFLRKIQVAGESLNTRGNEMSR